MRAYNRGNQTLLTHLAMGERVYHEVLPLDRVERHDVNCIKVLFLAFGAIGAEHQRAATGPVHPGSDSMPRYNVSPQLQSVPTHDLEVRFLASECDEHRTNHFCKIGPMSRANGG
jgi:hypothetical protein